jgi:hypothetical protein
MVGNDVKCNGVMEPWNVGVLDKTINNLPVLQLYHLLKSEAIFSPLKSLQT